jgi:hypothetical protein
MCMLGKSNLHDARGKSSKTTDQGSESDCTKQRVWTIFIGIKILACQDYSYDVHGRLTSQWEDEKHGEIELGCGQLHGEDGD